jgi:NADH dehydrogenase
MLGEVIGVDTNSRQVIVDSDSKAGLRISYDNSVLATGAARSYFGHDEFARFAPGLRVLQTLSPYGITS